MLIAINKRLEAFRRNEKGFTMLEVLMVLVVLGIVAAVLGSQLFSSAEPAQIRADELTIERLNSAAAVFFLDNPAATTVTVQQLQTGNYIGDGALPEPQQPDMNSFVWNNTTDTFQPSNANY
jgi:prepilin-type N-terminal cleavage/methylation domain-containing protein